MLKQYVKYTISRLSLLYSQIIWSKAIIRIESSKNNHTSIVKLLLRASISYDAPMMRSEDYLDDRAWILAVNITN